MSLLSNEPTAPNSGTNGNPANLIASSVSQPSKETFKLFKNLGYLRGKRPKPLKVKKLE
jgi:hypothetical protein